MQGCWEDLGAQLGGEKRSQEKEMAPKEEGGSAPPWLSSDQLQKLFSKALRTWDKRTLRIPSVPECSGAAQRDDFLLRI